MAFADMRDSIPGGRLFEENYQEHILNELGKFDYKGLSSPMQVKSEADRRYMEDWQARRLDAAISDQLSREWMSNPSNGDLVFNADTNTYLRKSNKQIYRVGQYTDQVRAYHGDLDRIERVYGLARTDLDHGRELETARQIAESMPNDTKAQERWLQLRTGMGDKYGLYRRYAADNSKDGKRGFTGNLGSWLTGRGWKEEDRFVGAWNALDNGMISEGYFQKPESEYADMTGKKGMAEALGEIALDPTRIAPFFHHLNLRQQYVTDAAIRLSSHNVDGGRDLYLSAAGGDQEKARMYHERDQKILDAWKMDKQSEIARGNSLAYQVTGMVRDMLPYALELGPVGRIATGMTNLLSRGTTSAAKALGGVTNATKFYKAAKHAIAPMAGLTANAHNVLAMAGGLANQEIADSAIVEDADGNYIYDTSRIDGKTITRNSMIQAAAEIGSEFSGGMLRNLFKAAGGNFASTGIRRLNILFRKI